MHSYKANYGQNVPGYGGYSGNPYPQMPYAQPAYPPTYPPANFDPQQLAFVQQQVIILFFTKNMYFNNILIFCEL